MPDYSFFFSYASADRDVPDREADITSKQDFVRIFFDDLDRAMKGLGYSDGGFFDKKRLEGAWKPELSQALASSRILVPLYSRNYFRSAYCGKEWETFNLRFQENEGHRFADVTTSQVILPVLWKAPVALPNLVSQYQIVYEDYPPDYRKEGLEYLLRFQRYSKSYQRFVWVFARKLLALADAQGAAKVRDVQQFDTLNPPFPGSRHPGLKHVRYVFVAGMKNEMPATRSSIYGNYVDRRDWLPCFPNETRPVEGIATGPARADNRGYEILPPTVELLEQLRDARRLNNVIVVVVDPWSVKLQEFHQFLRDFDSEEFPNSAVLVNWNNNDQETLANMQQLQEQVRDYFRGRIGRKEFHRDPVPSLRAFEDAVIEAFNAVQARLMETGKIPPAGGEPQTAPVIRN